MNVLNMKRIEYRIPLGKGLTNQ